MERLRSLFEDFGQSPWLDNIRRSWLLDGHLQKLVGDGVRGLTSNPSIFQAAISTSDDYDVQLRDLAASGAEVEHAYWELVKEDIRGALGVLRPLHDASGGIDGWVSVEVDPRLAHDASATVAAARALHGELQAPNLFVKVPGTEAGVEAIRELFSEGSSVNVTLLFSVKRYGEVIDAYMDGLEAFGGDLGTVGSVASFFVSRVDSEIDRRLDSISDSRTELLRGRAAVANAQLAFELFQSRFQGPRWDALAKRGARVQRPLWASTSTKDPRYSDTLYVDTLIGPDTVNTLPDATLLAFADHGALTRSVDSDPEGARQVITDLSELGIDIDEVTALLEEQGVAAFVKAYEDLLTTLSGRMA